jgi:hypothetical protein
VSRAAVPRSIRVGIRRASAVLGLPRRRPS